MKRVPPPLIGAALAMLFFTGCQMEGSSLTVRSTGGAQGPTGYEVSEAGPELAGLVKIVRAVPRNEQGERVAQVDVQNLTQVPLSLEYQVRWRDKFGSELITLWEWRHATLGAGKTLRLDDEAIDSEWIHYIFELRLEK